MCDDRDMVCLAVASVGEALRHASQRLRADRDVVELATDGMALQCVQQPLQTCAQIVAIAVQQNGLALQFTPASCSVNNWSPKPCITMALRFDAPAL